MKTENSTRIQNSKAKKVYRERQESSDPWTVKDTLKTRMTNVECENANEKIYLESPRQDQFAAHRVGKPV